MIHYVSMWEHLPGKLKMGLNMAANRAVVVTHTQTPHIQ